jgi:hypothetical protein
MTRHVPRLDGQRNQDIASSSHPPGAERPPCGSAQYVDAGFDHIVLQNVGPDPEGSVNFFTTRLEDRLRSLAPAE